MRNANNKGDSASITINLPLWLVNRLSKRAGYLGTSKSQVVSIALESYFKSIDNEE